jgi:hypothetical protein
MSVNGISQSKLLKMHIEALFTLDSQSRMVTINEPWDKTKAAPRLYLGKTFDGSIIYKFRCDIQSGIIKKLEKYLLHEKPLNEIEYTNKYFKILESKNHFEEMCYYYKDMANTIKNDCVKITTVNIKDFKLNGFEWLNDEIRYCQPCYGIVKRGKIISICRSVRIMEEAHEAGIETAEEHRGKGLAKIVLINWANDVQNEGYMPLYSTSKGNKSSQKVAEKEGLNKYGIGISIT